MSRPRRLTLMAVVAAIGIVSGNRYSEPIARIDSSQELADSPPGPIVPAEPLDEIRKMERSRRAVRHPGDPRQKNVHYTPQGERILVADGTNYEEVWKGRDGKDAHPKPAEPMPPTYCRSVEPVPEYDGNKSSGPHHVHWATVTFFENESGFGFFRMFYFKNDRGVMVSSRTIDRVELVSLLTSSEPSVYVLDEMATPPLARQAKRRPLDEFERLGLDAVRRGEELVWTREAPTRMFGAIRVKTDCLHCHSNAKKGDLLGAFTYYLNTPVEKLNVRE